jgi:hypothetical protein
MKTEQNLDNCTEQALTIPAVGGILRFRGNQANAI